MFLDFTLYVADNDVLLSFCFRIIRADCACTFCLQLEPLVPVHQFDKLPSYFIFAGLVFVPLTQPYLHEYGEDWYNASPRRLCDRALRELPQKAGQQLVILSQVSTIKVFLLYLSFWFKCPDIPKISRQVARRDYV